MTTWADIQRLASDLQRVQLATVANKLSERNCVEVVRKLIDGGLVDVVFTRDGSAYITKSHLSTLVRNEVAGAGGRLPMDVIAAALNVDLQHVESASGRVAQSGGYTITNGELISNDYIVSLHSQLRVMLDESGLLLVGNLARHWQLPADTLLKLLTPLPDHLNAVLDGEEIYSRSYMRDHKHKLHAILSAITKVTPISVLMDRSALPPARFYSLLDELVTDMEVYGRFTGSRNSSTYAYVPALHDRLVEAFVKRSLLQNEFILTSTFRKLALGDGKSTLQSVLGAKEAKELIHLPSLVCTKAPVDALIAALQHELTERGVADSSAIQNDDDGVPFSAEDLVHVMNTMAHKDNTLTVDGEFLFSSSMMDKALEEINAAGRLQTKASEWMDRRMTKGAKESSAPPVQQKKATSTVDDDDDWDDGKAKKGKGKKGGATKEKAARGGASKAGAGKAVKDKDQDAHASLQVSVDEIEEWLENVPAELRAVVAEKIQGQVEERLREAIQMLTRQREEQAATSARKRDQLLRQEAVSQYNTICTLEYGAEQLGGALADDLKCLLLKSQCGELAALLLHCASSAPREDCAVQKKRDEVIAGLSSGANTAFSSLFASLKSDSLDEFHDALQEVSSRSICDIALTRPEVLPDVAVAAEYVHGLEGEVTAAMDRDEPAAALLSFVLLSHARKGRPVYATGKFVSQLLPLLKDDVDDEVFTLMKNAASLVVAVIKNKGDTENKASLDDALVYLKDKLLPSA